MSDTKGRVGRPSKNTSKVAPYVKTEENYTVDVEEEQSAAKRPRSASSSNAGRKKKPLIESLSSSALDEKNKIETLLQSCWKAGTDDLKIRTLVVQECRTLVANNPDETEDLLAFYLARQQEVKKTEGSVRKELDGMREHFSEEEKKKLQPLRRIEDIDMLKGKLDFYNHVCFSIKEYIRLRELAITPEEALISVILKEEDNANDSRATKDYGDADTQEMEEL